MYVQQDQLQAYHIYVSGKVQGVYYRVSAAKKAQALGLAGWVKNLADGRVELFVQGPTESLERLLKWCHKGPILAKVKQVEFEVAQFEKDRENFDVVR